MSKSTTAVILPSPAMLGPWGDDQWRFAGAIQYVSKGPDFLWAQSPRLDGGDDRASEPFASMTVRESPRDKAADIAVMVFALLQVEEWSLLHPWWHDATSRDGIRYVLDDIVERYRDRFKLAVMETADGGLGISVLEELQELGFRVETFTPSSVRA